MIDPLAEHLDAVRKRGRIYKVGRVVLVGSYLLSAWLSGWSVGVIITGCIVCLIVIGLAYRIRSVDAEETDRLMTEQILNLAKRMEDDPDE